MSKTAPSPAARMRHRQDLKAHVPEVWKGRFPAAILVSHSEQFAQSMRADHGRDLPEENVCSIEQTEKLAVRYKQKVLADVVLY